jgi:hypothetical protein
MTIVEAAEQLKQHPIDMEAAAQQWAEENAGAIRDHQARIEKYGVFGEDLRRAVVSPVGRDAHSRNRADVDRP